MSAKVNRMSHFLKYLNSPISEKRQQKLKIPREQSTKKSQNRSIKHNQVKKKKSKLRTKLKLAGEFSLISHKSIRETLQLIKKDTGEKLICEFLDKGIFSFKTEKKMSQKKKYPFFKKKLKLNPDPEEKIRSLADFEKLKRPKQKKLDKENHKLKNDKMVRQTTKKTIISLPDEIFNNERFSRKNSLASFLEESLLKEDSRVELEYTLDLSMKEDGPTFGDFCSFREEEKF